MKALVRLVVSGGALLCLLAAPLYVSAAENTASPLPNKPARVAERSTSVTVEYEGTDSIGARLATRLKEMLNSSNLFTLTEKDTPKIRILISTAPEFSTRPGVGSAYAVVWVFSQSETILRHYLTREVGVLTPDDVNNLAAKLVEQTDGLAVRYGYLFQ